jgi:hypothetical protein
MNQLQLLRKMTGEQKLEQAIELSEITRELSMTGIKKQLGSRVTKKKINEKLRERIEYGSKGYTDIDI